MRSLLPEKYEVAKADLMLELEQVDTCNVTTDFWTSASMEGYVMPLFSLFMGTEVFCVGNISSQDVAAHSKECCC